MKLEKKPPEELGYNIELWESENSIWQVRLDQMAYGRRVHVMQKGDMCYQTEYCAGSNPIWQQALLGVVKTIVEQYEEDNFRVRWPRYGIRPMFNDPDCWHKLCRMAGMDETFEKSMLEIRYGENLEILKRHNSDGS